MKRLQQTRREFAAAAALPLLPAVLTAQKNNGGHSLYVGTYTTKNGSSKGIYHYRFDSRAGVLEEVGLAAAITNPSFLAWSPDGAHLYAVSELGATGPQRGSVSSFACSGKDGALQHLNTVVTGGGGACHLVVDKTRKMLVAANYTTGSVASFAVKADGSLSELVSLVQHSGSSVDVKR